MKTSQIEETPLSRLGRGLRAMAHKNILHKIKNEDEQNLSYVE